jgi:mannose-6-phosphate isomerase
VWRNEEPTNVDLRIGQSFRITPNTIHQMEAVTDCDVLEASTPHLDDVVRLQDRYGRQGTSAP